MRALKVDVLLDEKWHFHGITQIIRGISDMTGPTTNHEEILRWADSRGAVPAETHPLKFDGEPAVLSFLFGDLGAQAGEVGVISWEQFFALFDLMGLSLVYDDVEYELLQIEAKSVYRFGGKPM